MRGIAFGPSGVRWLNRVLCLLVFAALAGCGASRAKVSGRVLFNGAPLPGGLVTFRPEDPAQNSVSARIDEQGNYQALVSCGNVQVSVDNRELEPQAREPGGLPPGLLPQLSPDAQKALGAKQAEPPSGAASSSSPKSSSRYVPIPPRYYDIETSNLKFRVDKGEQQHDLELYD
jgi:hypothetical protein